MRFSPGSIFKSYLKPSSLATFANPTSQDANNWSVFATAAHFATTQRDSFPASLPQKIIERNAPATGAKYWKIPKVMHELHLSFSDAVRFKKEVKRLTWQNANPDRTPDPEELEAYDADQLLEFIKKNYGRRMPRFVSEYLRAKQFTGRQFFDLNWDDITRDAMVIGPKAFSRLDDLRREVLFREYYATETERLLVKYG